MSRGHEGSSTGYRVASTEYRVLCTFYSELASVSQPWLIIDRMLACVACGTLFDGPLCASCRADLTPGRGFVTPGGVLVRAALGHSGAARRLVHHLKYSALSAAGHLLADAMVAALPPAATALVPVPRARLRRWQHGIDPGDHLARAVGRRTGLPVVTALRPGWWWPRHAGRGDGTRSAAVFSTAAVAADGWVFIDDVATSAATIDAAAAALAGRVRLGVVATAPSRMRGVAGRTVPRAGRSRDPSGHLHR